MKRRSPIRHKVRTHKRKGKIVQEFMRGKGKRPISRKLQFSTRRRSLNAEGWHAPYGEERKRVSLSTTGNLKNWRVGGKEASGISYDHKYNKFMVMDSRSFHEAMEEAIGYEGVGFNKARLTRFTLMPDKKEFRVYTYGHGPRSTGGVDGFPELSLKFLNILSTKGIINQNDNILVYFTEAGKTSIGGTSLKMKEAIRLLRLVVERRR